MTKAEALEEIAHVGDNLLRIEDELKRLGERLLVAHTVIIEDENKNTDGTV